MSHIALIPPNVQTAAKRAFLRTTIQGYAATLSTGLTATAVLSALDTLTPLTAGVAVGVAVLSPLIAGAAAWGSITYQGIPTDYQGTVPATLF